ncbi:DUF2339 domain-containing protein [Vibrio scophthalmi]|uniref:Putative integral membrane protein n=1 Tax=Vibrio scophthalmi LMG 19158 TaxID=870967 RepID=F9RVB8_9VIBR|nr:DUF2339 domain-containing protein [Vibrio scophthalmi]EGU29743.1 putative integral membrane protein [Vibrio scophthalmi LMG 19158]
MELLVVVLGLAVIATPIIALVAFIKVQSLERQVSILTQKVAELRSAGVNSSSSEVHHENRAPNTMHDIAAEPSNTKSQTQTDDKPSIAQATTHSHLEQPQSDYSSIANEPLIVVNPDSGLPLPPTKLKPRSPQTKVNTSDVVTQLFDRWLGHVKENWLVWVGGVAMVIGVAYLIETVGTNFTIPLFARVLIAILLSCSMIGLGEWLHRKITAIDGEFLHQKADAYIPAAVYGAGMSGLYGTVIFSAVIHAFLPPALALGLMAILAAAALALTQRLGPLMAVLGLFGGYTAPIWIGGTEPNFILLSCYITSISIAGMWVQQLTRIPWLTYGIIALHSLWLFAIAYALPQADLLLWFVLFVPVSCYLLVFVPQLGWSLGFQCHYRTRPPFFNATIPAAILATLSAFLLDKTPVLGWWSLIYFVLPVLLLIFPACRRGRAPRSFAWVNVVAALSIIVTALMLMESQPDIIVGILVVSGELILLLLLRTIMQYERGDKSRVSGWQAVILAPLLVVLSLFYIDHYQPEYRLTTTFFAVVFMLLLAWLAIKFVALRANLSVAIHALLLTIGIIYSAGGELTLFIAAQMLLMAMQVQRNWLAPNLAAFKALGSLLVVRLSLLPFFPELQTLATPQWSWLLLTIVPSVLVFAWIRHMLRQRQHGIAEWFDAAMLHLLVILIFAQTNYLLLGYFNFLYQFEFENIAIFAGQSLALMGVYQFKAYHSQSLHFFYRCYSLLLLAVAVLCAVILNTVFQPFTSLYVLGSDWPVLNWLSVGWLVPALILVVIARLQLYPNRTREVFGAAATLMLLWVMYSIRQFWQQGPLTLDMPTSMAELFSYSVALILLGVAITYYALQHEQRILQSIGFAMLGVAACKVFLWDAAALEGLWRAISFMGLGGCLIGLGWLFQRLQIKTGSRDESLTDRH